MRRTIGLAFALVLVMATPAFAHVAVTPEAVPAGEVAELTFRVPNETTDANTTKVEIVLPEGAKFEFVNVKPVPGWTHTEQKTGDAITGVTWEGGKIAPNEFQEFSITAGPIAGKELVFKAVQTYDNGDVVRWIDPEPADGSEAEHPAPTATIIAEGSQGASSTTSSGDDSGADPLEFVALAVAGLALVGAIAALIMGRQRPPA